MLMDQLVTKGLDSIEVEDFLRLFIDFVETKYRTEFLLFHKVLAWIVKFISSR